MSALSSMFSDAAKAKFERKVLPTSIPPKITQPAEQKEVEPLEKKVKKPKWTKERKEQAKLGKVSNNDDQTNQKKNDDDEEDDNEDIKETAAEIKSYKKALQGNDSDDEAEAEAEAEVSKCEENENDNAEENETSSLPEQKNRAEDKEKNQRTVFVGNLPISLSKKAIEKIFSEFGDIESLRLRSVPIEGVKVDDAGNQNLVRKVAVNKNNLGKQKGSVNAYIVFKDVSSAQQALTANNRVVEKRHIRVDTATPTIFNNRDTVFIGNVPFLADEEELREHFAKAMVNGHNDIIAVRLVRDAETLIGKGFAYMLFQNRECVMKALTLNNTKFKKIYDLRVKTCAKRTKKSTPNNNKEGARNNKRKRDDDDNEDDDESDKNTKRSKPFVEDRARNKENYMKRITFKGANTKKKFVKSRGKK